MGAYSICVCAKKSEIKKMFIDKRVYSVHRWFIVSFINDFLKEKWRKLWTWAMLCNTFNFDICSQWGFHFSKMKFSIWFNFMFEILCHIQSWILQRIISSWRGTAEMTNFKFEKYFHVSSLYSYFWMNVIIHTSKNK